MLSVLLVIYSLCLISYFKPDFVVSGWGSQSALFRVFFLILCVSFTLSFLLRRQFLINEEIKIEQEMFQFLLLMKSKIFGIQHVVSAYKC